MLLLVGWYVVVTHRVRLDPDVRLTFHGNVDQWVLMRPIVVGKRLPGQRELYIRYGSSRYIKLSWDSDPGHSLHSAMGENEVTASESSTPDREGGS